MPPEIAAEIGAMLKKAIEEGGGQIDPPPCCSGAARQDTEATPARTSPGITTFAFDLGQEITLSRSGERGIVVGRAEFTNAVDSYYVRYVAGDGRQTEAWWPMDAIEASST